MVVPGGGGGAGGSGTAVVTEAPRPKSPPGYPDLCGRHKLQVEVQVLNREIGFLEEELHSLDGLQPASRCCKEVHEYVASNSDPMIPTNRKKHKSCCLWRWIRKRLCFNFAWVCCSSRCSCKFRRPSCSCNPLKRCCCDCHLQCCQCRCSHCCCWGFPKLSCCRPCCCCGPCKCKRPSCPKCSCGCVFSCPSCADSCLCPKCTRPCCVSRCLCP